MFSRAVSSISEGIMMRDIMFSQDHTKMVEFLTSVMPDAAGGKA
jgi:hypothetical protein